MSRSKLSSLASSKSALSIGATPALLINAFESIEVLLDLRQHSLSIQVVCNVCLAIDDICAAGAEFFKDTCNLRFFPLVIDGQVKSGLDQALANPETNSTSSSRY